MKKALYLIFAVVLIFGTIGHLAAQEIPTETVDTTKIVTSDSALAIPASEITTQDASGPDTLVAPVPKDLEVEAQTTPSQEKNSRFSPGWAIGIKASSFGPGIEVMKSFTEVFTLRLGGTYFKYNYDLTFDDALSVGEQGVITTGSISVLADFNFLSFMHFTGGLIYNMNEVVVDAKPTEDYYVGDIKVEPETLGTLYYSLTPNKVCPYVALGFGRSISRYKIVSFTFEAGLIYQGPPKVGLEATGMLTPTDNYAQQQLLESNVQTFTIYPVVNFQLSFRLNKR